MEYSIPVVQPVSLAESMKQWQDVKKGQQEQKLNEMKLANAPEEQAMLKQQHAANLANSQQQLQAGQQTFDIKQHAQLKGLTTDIMAKIEQTAQAQGIPADPNNPQYQQLAHQIYTPYIPAIQQVTGKQIDPNQPVNIPAIAAIAGSTPGQQQAQDIQGKVAEQQALLPGNIQAVQAKYGYQQQSQEANQNRLFAQQEKLAAINNDAAAQRQEAKLNMSASKPLPAPALKMVQEDLDAIGTHAGISADLGEIKNQLESGKLDLGLFGNAANKALINTGLSTEESRNFASFQSTLEKLRNDSLRLNKGVQTEGDSQRAWNEILTNINDKKYVEQRLGEVQRINDRAVNLRKMNIDYIHSNYGKESPNLSGYENQPTALGNQPAQTQQQGQFKSPEEIKAAVRSGSLSRENALKALTQFGME
jgi:hypothetical protein